MTALAHRVENNPPASAAPLDPGPLQVRLVALHDPLVQPMLTDLSHEYHSRYEKFWSAADLRAEMEQYPAEGFEAPAGALLLLLRTDTDGNQIAVAGGAFRRRVEPELGPDHLLTDASARTAAGTPAVATAELKRVWTDAPYRRLGLGGVVLRELERRAAGQGYERIYLTTGPRQPEAVALYLRGGYHRLFDPSADPEAIGPHPFEKWLSLT